MGTVQKGKEQEQFRMVQASVDQGGSPTHSHSFTQNS